MYNLVKNTITKLVPRHLIFTHEEKIRSIYSLFYKGNKYQCNIFYKELKKFINLERGDTLCPNCGSIERNRRLWNLLDSEFLKPEFSVLDFSPSRCLYRKLKKSSIINYTSTDLSGDFIADYQYDITNLQTDDNAFDLVICYHILEHVTNDIAAMQELYRVLKFGGTALVQTPFKDGTIYENENIITSEDRLHHFGQEDHVRIYSINGLKERLEECGFTVKIRDNFPKNNYNRFNNSESLLVLSKPIAQ